MNRPGLSHRKPGIRAWLALLAWLLGLCFTPPLAAQDRAADSLSRLGLDLDTACRWSTEGRSEFTLPRFPLDPASLKIRNGPRRLEPGVDFLVEAHSGRVRLLSTRDLGASLDLSWTVLRLDLPTRLGLRTELELPWLGAEGAAPGADSLAPPVPLPREEAGNLRYSGSFLRAIKVGGGSGVGMESGLRLQVDGQLGPGVEVEAFLSDQGTPLVPEGRSESLEEIDRIHVSVRSPHWHTLMGDFDLALAGRHYLEYRRTVDGLEGGWRSGPDHLRGWAALARGRTRRLELAGLEGVQGPWQLLSEQGRSEIIVLAGSERVWLDGQPVQRGEDRDYTIDYSLGQVLFTARRPITADTRITVEYQYSERVYNRSLLGAVGSGRVGPVSLAVAAVSEGDDPDKPLDQFLGEADRALLAAAGDAPEGALGSGIREVDPGEGSYRRVDGSGRWGRFEFAEDPPDSLAAEYKWELRFTELGRDSQGALLGDYERRFTPAGRPWWEFVGEAAGRWAPVVPLAAPRSLQLVDLQARWQPGPWSFELESAASREDLNLFSGLDDGDNLGGALRLRTGLESRRSGRLGRGRLGLTLAGEQAGFRTFSPADEVEFSRTWGLERTGSEDLWRADLEAALAAGDTLAQRLVLSLLERGQQQSRLLGLSNRLPLGRHTRLVHDGRWRRQSEPLSRSDWHRIESRLERDLGPLTLLGGLDTENRRSLPEGGTAEGVRHTEWQGGARWPLGPALQVSLDGSRRNRERLETGWQALNRTDMGRLRLRLSSGSWSGETDWSHRETRWASGDSSRTVTDLALLDLDHRSRHLEASVLYRAENSLVQDRLTQFIQVDSLQGEYSPDPFNPGIFVPDPDGSWVAISVDTGARRRVAAVGLESSVRYTAENLPGLSGETRLELEGRGPVDQPARLYALQPGTVLGDSILSGSLRLRQDLELEDGGGRRWRLRHGEEREKDRRLLQNPLERSRRETGLRCRLGLGASTRISLELRRRGQAVHYLQTPSADREVLAHALEGEWLRDLRQDLQTRVTLKVERGRERRLALSASTLRVDPRLEWRRTAQSYLALDGSWQQCWADGPRIPYELLEGARVGKTLRAGAEVRQRIGRQTSFTLSWRMDRLPDREAIHSGRAQIQSFF